MAAPSDDAVAKYKRLLSMARSSLEANQVSIASKDEQIRQLLGALEEEKLRAAAAATVGSGNKDDELSHQPRKILCRVDVEDVWVLIEYEDMDDTWKSFGNETALNDYIQRIPGVPLTCPRKCLSMEESIQIVRPKIPSSFNNNSSLHLLITHTKTGGNIES